MPEPAAHYFDTEPDTPSRPKDIVVGGVNPALRLRTDRGVFSHGQLDAGTNVLLRSTPPLPTTGRFLDLGCGAGAMALVMARRSPDATIVAVDVNERARRLTADNASSNDVTNVVVAAPDDDIAIGTTPFDVIWSNPPIRIGKVALHEILRRWLGRLTPDGYALLVVHKNLGSDSLQRWLTEQGHPTQRLISSRGYRLLRTMSGATPAPTPDD